MNFKTENMQGEQLLLTDIVLCVCFMWFCSFFLNDKSVMGPVQ